MVLRPKFHKFLIGALVVATASSCGLKGPLYRPDEPKGATTTPAEDEAAPKKKAGDSITLPPAGDTDPARPAVPPDN
jgi:predicted small lipoprotein YifL